MNTPAFDVVDRAYRAVASRDLVTLLSLFAPGIEIAQSEELPWGGSYRGNDAARQFFAKLASHIAATLAVERFISANDRVVAIGWAHGHVISTGAEY